MEYKSPEISKRFEFIPNNEDKPLEKAMNYYLGLVTNKEFETIRIVISRHWASEGIWVEAGNNLAPVTSSEDYIYKQYIKV